MRSRAAIRSIPERTGSRRRGLRLRRFASDRSGVTAIEFSLVAMPFLAIICAVFEIGFYDFQNEMLANSVNLAARAMLTGNLQTAGVTSSQAFVNQYICPNLPTSFTCANLIVDVRSTTTFAAGDTTKDIYNSSTNEFCPGQPGQIMVLRVAYPLPAVFPANLFSPGAGVVTNVPNLPGRYHILLAAALFEEENYSGSYTSPAGC